MRRQSPLMLSLFAAWIVSRPLLIWASARPCWLGLGHRRFAWAGGGSTTGLTSTAGWITISLEGGP